MESERESEEPARCDGEHEAVRVPRGRRLTFVARLTQRVWSWRERYPAVEVMIAAVERDFGVGGWILAGAIAYRVFLLLLPLSLVAVGGLGIAAHAASNSVESAARSVGLAGLVSSSVASAAESPARWYALVIGLALAFWEVRTLLRGLIAVHRLIWGDPRPTAPKPTVIATLRLLAVIVALLGLSALASRVRAASVPAGLAVLIVDTVPYAALWLLVSDHLSHSDAPWRALVPGAVLFAGGFSMVHLFTAYWLEGEVTSRQGTYGSLGLAAAVLLGLYVISRLIVAAAILNATLWHRPARVHRLPRIRG
jgi:membrane protein